MKSPDLRNTIRVALAAGMIAALTPPAAQATWSIVITDTRTGEVAIGQASCVAGIDLAFYTPVVVTDIGAATVAGYADVSGVARAVIRDELYAGTSPLEILQTLSEEDPEHETHQYCIVDVAGNCATYSGTVAMAQFNWAGGLAGTTGDLAYSVTGGLLTGAGVVEQAVQAIIDTDGSLGDKLMASMQAARVMGGDGRCSCSPTNPTSCGCPPPFAVKSAINGYMLLARTGDTADCVQCSNADLYLNLNVAFQPDGSPDPVLVMQDLYDTWRAGLAGRPDAVRSVVAFDPPVLPPDGVSTSSMTITLLDLDGAPISVPISSFTVQHADSGAAITDIGSVVDHGGGVYSVQITAGTEVGVEQFEVFADDGIREVQLMPSSPLSLGTVGEIQNVRWSDKQTINWDADYSAVEYHVYGGDVSELSCEYSGLCLDDRDAVRSDTSFTDPVEPLGGECFFYLISCEDSGGGESDLGESACVERLNAFPC